MKSHRRSPGIICPHCRSVCGTTNGKAQMGVPGGVMLSTACELTSMLGLAEQFPRPAPNPPSELFVCR